MNEISSRYLPLEERLNLILPRITSNELLNNEGLGNDIGFHIATLLARSLILRWLNIQPSYASKSLIFFRP